MLTRPEFQQLCGSQACESPVLLMSLPGLLLLMHMTKWEPEKGKIIKVTSKSFRREPMTQIFSKLE